MRREVKPWSVTQKILLSKWWRLLDSSPRTMKIMSWNCWRLGNQCAVDVLSHLVRKKAPKILFLMETKQSVSEMKQIQASLPYRCMFVVPTIRRSGGLALLWLEEIELHVQTFTLNHIDALIMDDPANPWRLTGFYRWPEKQQKQDSWKLLKHLHSRHSVPWLCFGNFNEILQSEEKQGRLPKPLAPVQDFRTALLHCCLADLGFRGNLFTWNNGRERDAYVQERLDKACTTTEWRDKFPHSHVTHLQATYFDHIPILITIQSQRQARKKKIPQRFEER